MKFLTDLSTSQVWAQLRHYITFVAGVAAAIGILTVVAQPTLVDGAMTLLGRVEKIVATLVTLAGAITLLVNALKASRAASPAAAVERVQEMATDPKQPQAQEAKEALVAATNSIPEVKGVVTDKTAAGIKLAESTPAPTVVPAGTPEAIAVAKGEMP